MTSLKEIRLFLLDMDGTIYHENELISGAKDFFIFLNSHNLRYAFMTNNSSKGKRDYVEKLNDLGIKASDQNIVSSVNVTIEYIKNSGYSTSNIFVVGTESFKRELREQGFKIFDERYEHIPEIKLVVLGFDTELTYEKIHKVCEILDSGCEYVATNCDLKCPVKGGRFIPDCGAIASMLAIATNREPKFLGKPGKEIVVSAANQFNVDISQILCVGDRLYTDIAVGINAGCPTAVVFTGETKPSDISDSEFKPTYQFDSIKDLYESLKNNVLQSNQNAGCH